MNPIDDKISKLIQKTCKGKPQMKLTVGYIDADGNQTIKVFGEHGEMPQDNYIYEIGSITKTFTASLMAKQIYEGRMSLDDSIAKYIDGLDSTAYYPTLKRLATHTAGYPTRLPFTRREHLRFIIAMIFETDRQGIFPFHKSLDRMKQLIRENPMQDRDYPWKYSNLGLAMLGYAVGAASGKGYKEAMGEFLSNELGLENTYTGTCPDRNLHGYTGKDKDIGNWVWGDDFTAPAGDISSNAQDLLKYARVNMYEILPYVSMCHKKYISSKRLDMGLGWIIDKKNNNVIWHSGGTGAFRTHLSVDKEKKLAVTVLSNYIVMTTDKIGTLILENLQKEKGNSVHD